MTVIMLALLSGCAAMNPSIENPPARDLQYAQVLPNLSQYQGEVVRWAGVVADVSNLENQSELTLVQFPVTRYGKPITTANSAGRFIVKSNGFLDPLIYEKGALVTVVGTLSGDETRKVGQKSLLMPVVTMTDSQVWPEQYADRERPYNPKHDWPFRGYGYYGTGSYSP
ncbi:MAG TPA: Slp family lipoprotein [Methylophaga sp.]|nr:Slp family lipoprotein [Methylophaga sp.]